jgi:hypothetical protein
VLQSERGKRLEVRGWRVKMVRIVESVNSVKIVRIVGSVEIVNSVWIV